MINITFLNLMKLNKFVFSAPLMVCLLCFITMLTQLMNLANYDDIKAVVVS